MQERSQPRLRIPPDFSDDLESFGRFGPVGDIPGRMGRLHPADAPRAEGDEQDIILGLEDPGQFPAEPMHGRGIQPAAEDRKLHPLSRPFQDLGRLAQPRRVVDIIANQPPLGIGHVCETRMRR